MCFQRETLKYYLTNDVCDDLKNNNLSVVIFILHNILIGKTKARK